MLLAALDPADAFRYLMVGMNLAYSHLAFDGRLADVLVQHGHEVVSTPSTFFHDSLRVGVAGFCREPTQLARAVQRDQTRSTARVDAAVHRST